jgi:hypothetical protein
LLKRGHDLDRQRLDPVHLETVMVVPIDSILTTPVVVNPLQEGPQ